MPSSHCPPSRRIGGRHLLPAARTTALGLRSRGAPPAPILLLLLLLPAPLQAQDQAQDPERRFSFETELGASFFFGNTEQVTFTNRSDLSRADSTAEFSLGWDIAYGEATDEEGVTFVNRRSWAGVTSVDLLPHARVSPFLFGTLEASLQKRIDRRFSGGAGAKLTFVDSDVALADLSAAALLERTVPLADGPTDPEVQARWSVRSRLRRSFDADRLALTFEALYVPAFDDPGDFTFRGSSSVGFALSSVVSLKLSFVDAYDSGARGRGARTNNDGQLLFSILSRF